LPVTSGNPGTSAIVRFGIRTILVLFAAGLLGLPSGAEALVRFDFEQMYFQHPDRQVWDFSIIRPDSVYHLYYHTIHESTPSAAAADTIWHATSQDLRHWAIEGPVLTVGQGPWDNGATWAPDVFRDDDNDRWVIAYTGCDNQMNQRICFAYSPDLFTWTKEPVNPVIVPDTTAYIWSADSYWSNFRDPFVYRRDGLWHILVTAKQRQGINPGALYHATSPDLLTWTDVGPIFVNDGNTPGRVLESPQYFVTGDYHHLLFGEYDTPGITVLTNDVPEDWNMAERVLLDYGYAPEVDEFDPGHRIFSRLAPYQLPNGVDLTYVIRLDTLTLDPEGTTLTVVRSSPLDENWAVHAGVANLANPVFEDNPLWRGEPSVGLVGHGYYSSKEYYQGPLSGRGGPGTQLGDNVTGLMESRPFTIQGQRMRLLVGGGNYPETCYVALVDLADSTVIYSETGKGVGPMDLREWNLEPHAGKNCIIRIFDGEAGPMGYINVDEIVEILDKEVPLAPTSFMAAYRADGVDLDWDDAPEPDFLNHRVYRSDSPDFIPGPGNLLHETTTSAWSDSTEVPWIYYYKITTVDWVGNESDPAQPIGVSGVRPPGSPSGVFLGDAVPNPFNPRTRISFETVLGGPVQIKVYDPAGRLVASLVDGELPAGSHHVFWDGKDTAGRGVAAGLYLYRLVTPGFSATRRMTLIK